MNEKYTIIRDTREKYGWLYPEDGACQGTIIDKLDVGDYTIQGLEDYICIERKRTIDEFAQNCIQKRWTKCMQRMSEVKHPYIIFEFSWYDVQFYPKTAKAPKYIKKRLRVPAAYIRRVIKTARHEYGIHVLACNDVLKAEKVAYRLLNKAYDLQLRSRI